MNQTGSKIFKIFMFLTLSTISDGMFFSLVSEKHAFFALPHMKSVFSTYKPLLGGLIIESSKCIQQGCLFGPVLFALSVDLIIKDIQSEFNV